MCSALSSTTGGRATATEIRTKHNNISKDSKLQREYKTPQPFVHVLDNHIGQDLNKTIALAKEGKIKLDWKTHYTAALPAWRDILVIIGILVGTTILITAGLKL